MEVLLAVFIQVILWKGGNHIGPYEDDFKDSIYTTEENMPDDYLNDDVVSNKPIYSGDVNEYYSSTFNARETSGLRWDTGVPSVNLKETFLVVLDSSVMCYLTLAYRG